MAKEKRYVEIEIEVDCDEEGLTPEAWSDFARLNDLYETMGDIIKHIGSPKKISRRELEK